MTAAHLNQEQNAGAVGIPMLEDPQSSLLKQMSPDLGTASSNKAHSPLHPKQQNVISHQENIQLPNIDVAQHQDNHLVLQSAEQITMNQTGARTLTTTSPAGDIRSDHPDLQRLQAERKLEDDLIEAQREEEATIDRGAEDTASFSMETHHIKSNREALLNHDGPMMDSRQFNFIPNTRSFYDNPQQHNQQYFLNSHSPYLTV